MKQKQIRNYGKKIRKRRQMGKRERIDMKKKQIGRKKREETERERVGVGWMLKVKNGISDKERNRQIERKEKKHREKEIGKRRPRIIQKKHRNNKGS